MSVVKFKKRGSPRGTGRKLGYPKGYPPLDVGYNIPSTKPKINSVKMASMHQVGTSVPVPSDFMGGSPEVITTKMPGGSARGTRKGGI